MRDLRRHLFERPRDSVPIEKERRPIDAERLEQIVSDNYALRGAAWCASEYGQDATMSMVCHCAAKLNIKLLNRKWRQPPPDPTPEQIAKRKIQVMHAPPGWRFDAANGEWVRGNVQPNGFVLDNSPIQCPE